MKNNSDILEIEGNGFWELRDAETGEMVDAGSFTNIVTALGGAMYAKRAVGIASPPNAPTGMKLGTGTTAASLTGAGAALGTYLGNSN